MLLSFSTPSRLLQYALLSAAVTDPLHAPVHRPNFRAGAMSGYDGGICTGERASEHSNPAPCVLSL
eukprot:4969011-Prymnesium_polylepis.1